MEKSKMIRKRRGGIRGKENGKGGGEGLEGRVERGKRVEGEREGMKREKGVQSQGGKYNVEL